MNIIDHTSTPSKPLPDIAGPQPCDKCKLTTCHSLHAYSASNCPYNICSECRELEVLDARIMEVHNLLVNLSLQRHDLKERINRRHDPFTSNLPNEIISHIFTFIVDLVHDPFRYRRSPKEKRNSNTWNPVLMVGAVCRRWRDITLGSPELWTKVRINSRNLEHASFGDMAAQWISRSCAVPFSLEIDMTDGPRSLPIRQYSEIVPVLRSQAPRWKNLTLRVPSNMLQILLTGLEDRLIVDSLVIYIFNAAADDVDGVTMKYPFVPTRLHIQLAPLPQIPIQWDSLTDLTAEWISVDDMVHIFSHAHNLQRSQLDAVKAAVGHYPIPSAPVSHTSIIKLTGNMKGPESSTVPFLNYLTLPSLEALHYKVENDNPLKIQALANFVDRSRPPLRDFHLNCFDIDPRFGYRWFPMLPSITSLYIDMFLDIQGIRIEECIGALSSHLTPIVLPCLRELTVHSSAFRLGPNFWNTLAGMFPDPQNNNEEASVVVQRPLKAVAIRLQSSSGMNQGIMYNSTLSRLRAIQESGVTLKVFGGSIDMLGPNTPLTFRDAEDEYDDEDSTI